MGILDGLLGQLGDNPELPNLAEKSGCRRSMRKPPSRRSPSFIRWMWTRPRAQRPKPVCPSKMQELIGHIGGEGALGRYASLLQGEGGLGGIAANIFGKS